MPIEDVDFLKTNSERQSYTFLVDSSDRDRALHPTPAEYTVDFTKPFRNVVGFEVVYASIPRTMYNVDVINNKVTFYIHDGTQQQITTFVPKQTVEIAPGEYTIQTLIVALNAILGMHVNSDPTKPFVYITAEATTNPPDVENKIRFRCPYPFFIDMFSSTCAETLGFDEYTQISEQSVDILKRRYANPLYSVNRQLYHSVDIDPNIKLGKEQIVFDGPRGVIRKAPVSHTSFLAQRFRLTSAGYIRTLYAALFTDVVDTNDVCQWEIRHSSVDGTHPDMTRPYIVRGSIAVSFIDGTLSDSGDVKAKLEANTNYWVVFYSNASDDMYLYYNDVIATDTTMAVSTDSGSSWSYLDNNGVYFNLSIRIVVCDEYHVLTAPGMYSLIGPKYIVLRCQEIEEHSFRSLAFSKYHLGLGMFKLGVVGYSENRMDFNKVPLREFHPIGKLTRLTLRFELPNGMLYDFKGVNHNITFAIHYLEPKQTLHFQQSILNPNYDGNFINYMYKQEDQEGDSEDQEDAEDFDRDRLEDYRRAEAYYLPENSARRDTDFVHRMPEFRELGLYSDDDE
jgi:hypothetical protein